MLDPGDGIDVLEVAIELEKTGEDFYEALAAGCDNGQVAQVCLRLAREEAKHRRTFDALRRRATARDGRAPRRRLPGGTEDLARRLILPKPDQVRKVGIGGRTRDVLELAARMERSAISYYDDLRQEMPEDRDVLSQIIEEETSHLEALKELMAEMGPK